MEKGTSACDSPCSFLPPAPLFPSLFQLLSTVSMPTVRFLFSVPGPCVCPRLEGAAPCPALGHSLLRPCPSSDMPLVHAVLWAFMFLPHNLLQARGTRCPEHPPVVTGTCCGFSPHPEAWQPFPAALSIPSPLLLSTISPIIPGNCPFSG